MLSLSGEPAIHSREGGRERDLAGQRGPRPLDAQPVGAALTPADDAY
jgi:hypothetical protein